MSSKDPKDEAQVRAEMLGDAAPADAPEAVSELEAAIAEAGGLSPEQEAQLRAEGIDPNHPILTIEEQRAAIARAKGRVSADAKKEALKAFEQQVYDDQRGRTGLRTGDPIKDELVHVTLDLAEHSDCIRINGHTFWHGHTYRVPRHVSDSLREIQQRGHHHQLDLDGKGLAERGKRPRLTAIKADADGNITGIQNAPQAA